jgi:type I restriction enzyme S subunit
MRLGTRVASKGLFQAMRELPPNGFRGGHRHFKPYPAYKNSGADWLGEIPTSWEAQQMWRISVPTSGGTPSKEQPGYWGGDIPWVSPKDMKRRFIDSSQDTITQRALAEAGLKLLKPPVILIVVRGMILAHTFPVAITTSAVTINQDMKALRLRPDIEPEFLGWFFEGLGSAILAAVVDDSAHGTRVIRMEQWRRLAVPVPSKAEQRTIVRYLNRETARIDALVEKKERLLELLRESRTAFITRAVTKGLDSTVPMKNSGSYSVGEVPAHWAIKRLRHVAAGLGVGVVVNPSQYISSDGLPFLYGSDVNEGSIDTKGCRRISVEDSARLPKSRLRPDDLVMVRVGAPGVTAVIPQELDGANCASMVVIRKKEDIDSTWLCFALNSRCIRSQVESVQYGAAQEQFNVSHAVNFLVPVPPFEEQRKIAIELNQKAAAVEALLEKIRDAIDCLKDLRTALISAAVTGKIDVRAGGTAVQADVR